MGMATFDVIIEGATLVDGTGAPARPADVGVAGSRVRAIGDLSAAVAEDIVEARGSVVCPGFIDMHTHSDLTPLMDSRCASKVRQGVTTELVGHCGFSAFPLVKGTSQERTGVDRAVFMGADIQANWSDCAGYLAALEQARPAFNMATLVGNGTIRSAVAGYDNRPPTADELKAMRWQVAQAMEQGAFGLSSGLTLYPSSVAQTDELVALCKEAARWGGLYDTHTRHLAGWHFKAVEEAIEIGRRAGIAVQVAHLCLIDPRYWGQTGQLFEIMESARAHGVEITFDAYPYTAAGCPFSEAMPGWVQSGGTEAMLNRLADLAVRGKVLSEANVSWFSGIPVPWDKVVIAWGGPYGDPAWLGKTVQELAEGAGITPEEMMLEVLVQSQDVGLMIVHNRLEEDVEQFVSHPYGMIGSDGIAVAPDGPWGKSLVHPRFYGTFPRVLAHFVRERKAIPLEEAIRKMTSLPADRLGLRDRGRLEEGFAADLVIFDPATVQDRATFENPHQYPTSISHVMVNGQWVVRDGEQTEARPGQILRHMGKH
ncbi:MAG TPA: D-aminoacylase [Anaerolineae bacterium]|nr:D-aminoacylase [Anaerolineae bacterium]